MNKNFTLLYAVNDFEQNEGSLIDLNLSEDFSDFQDVFEILDELMIQPKQKTINKILEFAKTSI